MRCVAQVKKLQVLDIALCMHIQENVRIIGTDAASDELRAGRIMARNKDPFFPRLKLHQRDPTHASRRTRRTEAMCSDRVESHVVQTMLSEVSDGRDPNGLICRQRFDVIRRA